MLLRAVSDWRCQASFASRGYLGEEPALSPGFWDSLVAAFLGWGSAGKLPSMRALISPFALSPEQAWPARWSATHWRGQSPQLAVCSF